MKIEEMRFKLKQREKEISFIDETHEYHRGKDKYLSVSGLIGKYSHPFPAEKIAPFSARKLGISTKEVLAMWKRNGELASIRGTAAHNYAEKILEGINPYTDKNDEFFMLKKTVENFLASLFPEQVICTEAILFSEEYKVAGQTDFLLYDPETQSVIVGDYKTNKDLYKPNSKKMKGILKHLQDTKLNHYHLQLSIYQVLIELAGLPVKKRKIVWFKEGTWSIINAEDRTKEAHLMLKERKEELK